MSDTPETPKTTAPIKLIDKTIRITTLKMDKKEFSSLVAMLLCLVFIGGSSNDYWPTMTQKRGKDLTYDNKKPRRVNCGVETLKSLTS
jgi:hypothetical protein